MLLFTRNLSQVANGKKDSLQKKKILSDETEAVFSEMWLSEENYRQSKTIFKGRRYRSQPPSGCVCYYQAVYDLCSFSVCVISIYLLLYVCGLDAIQLSNLQWMAELGLPRFWPCHHKKVYQDAPSNTQPHWIRVCQSKKDTCDQIFFQQVFTQKVIDLPIFFVLPQSGSAKRPRNLMLRNQFG